MEQATKQMLYAVNYLLPACTELTSGEVEGKDLSKSWFHYVPLVPSVRTNLLKVGEFAVRICSPSVSEART